MPNLKKEGNSITLYTKVCKSLQKNAKNMQKPLSTYNLKLNGNKKAIQF